MVLLFVAGVMGWLLGGLVGALAGLGLDLLTGQGTNTWAVATLGAILGACLLPMWLAGHLSAKDPRP